MCFVVKSIDYDVDLDFLLDFPKTPEKSVNGVEPDGVISELRRTAQVPSTYEPDCLITPPTPGTASVDRSVKVPSIDRSTKPPSAVQNNSVVDTSVENSSQPAVSIPRINNKLTSDKNTDASNDVSDSRILNKPGPATVSPSARTSIPPAAPDRSTKPVPQTNSSSDVNTHSAELEKEQEQLNILRGKKMQEASALANLMREKRKLEIEMEHKKQLIDSQSRTE